MKKSGKFNLHAVNLLGIAGLFILLSYMAGCTNKRTTMDNADAQYFLALGDSIASQAQMVLLANVSGAIAREGVAGAFNYCSEKAITLTDSLAQLYGASLQRLSDRNRNPDNSLQTSQDRESWEKIKALMSDEKSEKKHFINQENNQLFYFKAIPIGMDACLKCHGEPGREIDESTWALLEEKYPEDKATGYLLGQLRGMWKIKLADFEESK